MGQHGVVDTGAGYTEERAHRRVLFAYLLGVFVVLALILEPQVQEKLLYSVVGFGLGFLTAVGVYLPQRTKGRWAGRGQEDK